MQTTYDISDKGKGIPAQFLGKELPITIPDPHAADPIAEALSSGRYENAAALVSAANRSLRIMMRDDILAAATKEGATLESLTAAAAATKFPAPRVVDPNATPRKQGSGKIKAAQEKASKFDDRLVKLVQEGNARKLKFAVENELYTQEEVDACRARLEQAGTTAPQAQG